MTNVEPENVGSIITDHKYVSPSWEEPWGRCAHLGFPNGPGTKGVRCGLAEAAHEDSQTPYAREMVAKDIPYRCPDCVNRGIKPCTHSRRLGVVRNQNHKVSP